MNKPKVFVIMPFEDQFFNVYGALESEFHKEFAFSHAGNIGNQQNILQEIIQPIFEAKVILANLTGLNPNVLYELGIAHALDKKTIAITKDDLSTLPFDLKQYRVYKYGTEFTEFDELKKYISKNLKGAINEEIDFSNPVKDFLDKNEGYAISNTHSKGKIDIQIENSEKGFLDFLAEIDEDTESLTTHLTQLTNDMKILTSELNKSTAEIKQVQKSSGNGTASFVRKEFRKIASNTNEYCEKLDAFNNNYSALWDKIEVNILGLLENEYSSNNDNKDGLIKYLINLHKYQANILSYNKSIENLKNSSIKSIGLERTYTQALKILDERLATNLGIMSQVLASIDRIKEKSKFVVDKVVFN
ncbi:MAG: hypothetical protein FWD82_10905 [Defluviitaleaceae bacterium]|nr:hypothetical protein [Defluviitaleaceae bacterium]